MALKRELDGFPKRLRLARLQKDLSQGKLAELASLHFNQISRYEKGVSQPSAESIEKLARILDVSSDYLINGETRNGARADIEDMELLQLFKTASKFSDEDKKIIKRILSSIANQQKLEEMTAK
ncbi:MAG: helix-turn-helix transcriptional regulator [Spirochaetales bacterium]|nr:helix-turn-helix transcriptional regulator [Spirochaetales bacterium]